MIDFEPTEEQQLVIDTVRQFAANELRPVARDCEEAAKLPEDVLARAHELGLTANALPESAGGGGERSAVTGVLVIEELAWGDLALGLAALSPALTAFPVADLGSDAQREALLPRFTEPGFRPGSLAWVEPSMRFDPLRPETRARREGDGFVLDGHKCFVPWLEGADPIPIVAAEAEAGPQVFLVPRAAPGLAATRERNMGLRALPTAELELREVRVPAEARLGGEAGSPVRALLSRGRVAQAAAAVGVARAAFETARDYAKERHAFGVPIATKQAIAFKLADMAIEIDAARLLVWEAAWKLDRGEDAEREATLARQQIERVVLDATDGAVQVLGGHGYIRDYLPELLLRNARGFAGFEALALI